jgi:hypothetical protein
MTGPVRISIKAERDRVAASDDPNIKPGGIIMPRCARVASHDTPVFIGVAVSIIDAEDRADADEKVVALRPIAPSRT